MTPPDEDKAPLTLVNVLTWARSKFSDAFDALPTVGNVMFDNIDDFQFSRPIRRSLGRSEHKKLLLVGAHSPGNEVEDALVCAHIHAGDNAISYFRIERGANEEYELHTVQSTGHIAFHAPFCDVGDDTSNAKAIHRVEAIISYYFLTAGYLKELVRYKNFANSFSKGFEEGCRWIENGGERPPVTSASARACTIYDSATAPIAINSSILRSAARGKKATPAKRERNISDAQQKSNPKRVALGNLSSNIILKLPMEPSDDETAQLKAQIATLITEKADLTQQLAMQGHAYRGCQLDLDEAREEANDLQVGLKTSKEINVELRAGMKKIKEILNEHKY